MKCLIAHLTDIHIKGALDPILKQGEAIARVLYRQHVDCDLTCLVLSGDIAFSGKEDEYTEAKRLLDTIVGLLKAQKDCPIHIIAVPGNHDCDFSRDSVPRTATIEHILKGPSEGIDEDAVNVCTKVQDPFFEFLSKLTGKPKKTGFDRLFWTDAIEANGQVIKFRSINASWMSMLNEGYGRLSFPASVLKKVGQQGGGDIEVFVFHHPLNWFQQGNLHELRAEIRRSADFVLTGHEHVQNAVLVDDVFSQQSGFMEGGALSGDGQAPSAFNILEIDLDAEQFQSTLVEMAEGGYVPRELAPAWSSFRALPSKKFTGFEISEDFRRTLTDPGAHFTHPTKGALTLDDVFVFPDLREVAQGENEAVIRLSSNTLLSKGGIERALLVGEEKIGKTSLFYQLFRGFYNQGLVPVYLGGSQITGTTEREVASSISRAVKVQYAGDMSARFWETKSSERVCLIDDYDRIRGNEKLRARVVKYVKKHFQRVFISTTDAFQLEEYVIGDAADAFAGIRTFFVLQLGHKLRYQLIRKWTCGGNEAVMSLAAMTENIDRCERIIDSVLGRSFVPALPLFLLTLLQSLEAGAQADLSQSAFGHYYSYLIVRGLNTAKVKREEFDEVFNYCSHLAAELEKRDARELHQDDLRRFNTWYSDAFTPVSYERRVEQLTDAGIITKRLGGVGFKYPYFRYYFLGKFYADQIRKPDSAQQAAERIREKCRNLHVRENANTILFLTHHTKEPFVLEEIVGVLRKLFADQQPLRFDADVKALGDLVESASQTVVEEWDVEKNREELRAFQDEAYDARQSEEDRSAGAEIEGQLEVDVKAARRPQEEHAGLQVSAGKRIAGDDAPEEAVNLLADVNTLFKTVELLGQILKNYYGSLTNESKRLLMEEIFQGPLRALSDFLGYLAREKEALIQEIEAEIARRDKEIPAERRKQFARQIVFNTLGVVSFVFVSKSADAVNASTLRSLTRELADKHGTNAAKVIQLAAVLDSSEEVPMGDLKALWDRLEGNIFARKLIESFVYKHLYMFPTSITEKQQLQGLLKFDMQGMRALDLKTKESKVVKKKA